MDPIALTRRRSLGRLAAAGVGLLLVGCQNSPGDPSVASDNPELKIPAIKRDVALHDDRDESLMVRDLSDPDPAVRFYAVQGLQRLTGDDFGYRYYDDEPARSPAVGRWRAWVAAHPAAAADLR